MSDSDWFRQTQWTSAISSDFEARLARSRSQHSEYLRIQAFTLAETRDTANAAPAIQLATRYLERNESGLFAAQMHAAMALAYTTLGNMAEAVESYRRSVAMENIQRNVRGLHYIDFAWFAATHQLSQHYEEVLQAMKQNLIEGDLMFPATQYRYFGALAMISSDMGDKQNAKRMAANALAAAMHEKGPIRRYPLLGLVLGHQDKIRARLEHIAS